MAAATATCIMLTGAGLLLQDQRASWLRFTATLSTLSSLVIAVIGILGFIYQVGYLQGDSPFSQMSFATAFSLVALGLGILLVRPERPWLAVAISRDEGGALVRRLLPAVLLSPAILGWLELNAVRAGLVTNETGIATVVLIVTFGLAWLTLWVAQAANRRAIARQRLQSALQRMNEKLEKRVAERTVELEHIQGALVQAQKMEAVGQLTGGLAHDFNNLLTGIVGSLELLHTRVEQGRTDEISRYIAGAQGSANRAAVLTHRLLAFSRQQTLDPKLISLNRLVEGMEELIRRTIGPEIQFNVLGATDLWTTRCDPSQLENALLNLCINARHAMPGGGSLTVKTANVRLDAEAANRTGVPAGQYVALYVTDTGLGMPPEVIARAFDPFFTTKPIGEGSGLGLSMVYGFARQSGGQARIDSQVGKGTTIQIFLPRHDGPAQAEGAEANPVLILPQAPAHGTVLVVDDEPTIRMLVTEVLEELGYVALEAADGASGLKMLLSGTRVDLLVTDVGLPGGMNGRQVAAAARVLQPGLKVLFITGYAENALRGDEQLEPGMHILAKPFTLGALAACIKEVAAKP